MARRPRPPDRRPAAGSGDESGPSLVELEKFSRASLKQWLAAADRLRRLQTSLYFGLETVRKQRGASLLGALRFAARREFKFEGWSRIVDLRYSLAPLSTAGSLKGEGGRFNIGAELSPDAFTAFPALYIADNYDAAYREKFGQAAVAPTPLSGADLALRQPASFAQVRLRGALDAVLDISDPATLQSFVAIIKEFPLPKHVAQLTRQLGLTRPPKLIRTAATLQRQLLDPTWRMLPMQYDLPSNSQVFGRIASAAGIQGILYPSARTADSGCLALYPQNWRGSGCYVELMDPAPPEVRFRRLDGTTGLPGA